jgi:hypothetical protein
VVVFGVWKQLERVVIVPEILIVVSMVRGAATVSMQEFGDKRTCEFAAQATARMSHDLGVPQYNIRTWCVPQILPYQQGN